MTPKSIVMTALLALGTSAILAAACASAKDDGCECSSEADNYCDAENPDTLWRCRNGCHFSSIDCSPSGSGSGWSGCEDGECYTEWSDDYDTDSDDPYCWDELDNFCLDSSTLLECQTFYDELDNYYETVDCADPALCTGEAGCSINDDGIAACWCDESDGGVGDPDAGADGGA